MVFLLIIIVNNVIDILYFRHKYVKGEITALNLTNLFFFFLLYVDWIVWYFAGLKSEDFILGIPICWGCAYLLTRLVKSKQ